MQSVLCINENAFKITFSKKWFWMFCLCFYSCCVVLISHHCVLICHRIALYFSFEQLNVISIGDFECFLVYMCPSDAPTTLLPSTTSPLHPIPADPTALLGIHTSNPVLAGGNRGTVPSDTSPQALPLNPLRFLLCFCNSALRTFPFTL